MLKVLRTSLIALIAATAGYVGAVPVVFDMTYDGSSVINASPTLVGYTLPVGTNIQYTLHAEGNDYWHVDTGTSLFAALRLNSNGFRTGDVVISALLDGVTVASWSDINKITNFTHIGYFLFLAAGLNFDAVRLDYTFTGQTSATTQFVSNDFFSPMSSYTAFAYVQAPDSGQVPEPGSLALLGLGLAGLAAIRKRKQA